MRSAKLFLVIFCAVFAALSCGTKQPRVTDETLKVPSIDHVKFKSGCPECHIQDRLPPNIELNVTYDHGLGADCVACHTFPVFKTLNANVGAHNPYPTVCSGCHTRATEGSPHASLGDCATAGCHSFPDWSVIGAPAP